MTTFFLYILMLLPVQFQDNNTEQLLPAEYNHVESYAMNEGSSNEEILLSNNSSNEQERIIEAVTPYIDNMLPDDSLVEWEEDLWIKKSNLFGVELDGITYYYSLFPHMSFDPVSRGEVEVDEVDIIVEETGYIIYTFIN